MSDLVKRLRERSGFFLNGSIWLMTGKPDPDCMDAASRIEELEGALRDFVQHAVDSGWDGPMIERARELLK